MSERLILVKKDLIGMVTINNPPLNIIDSSIYEELDTLLAKVEEDSEILAVVMTGEGERAFCAGANVKEFIGLDKVTGFYYSARNQVVRGRLWNLSKPTIAAINGLALGAGCVIAMLCDMRIACEDAKFGLGEINMGILGGTQIAAKMLPSCLARQMIYTGEQISAEEAFQFGLLNKVTSRETLIPVALELAGKIAQKSPIAMRFAKQLMVNSVDGTLKDGLSDELSALRVLWGSEEKNEAVQAFLQKRPPIF